VNLATKTPGEKPTLYLNGIGGYTPIVGGRSLYELDGTNRRRDLGVWKLVNPVAVRCKVLSIFARPRTKYILRTGQRKTVMTRAKLRTSQVKLANGGYKALRIQVLQRDDWRCQVCGRCENLEVHHQDFRSHQGSDNDENLITLCNPCHRAAHDR